VKYTKSFVYPFFIKKNVTGIAAGFQGLNVDLETHGFFCELLSDEKLISANQREILIHSYLGKIMGEEPFSSHCIR
jgi:hypothetical protein